MSELRPISRKRPVYTRRTDLLPMAIRRRLSCLPATERTGASRPWAARPTPSGDTPVAGERVWRAAIPHHPATVRAGRSAASFRGRERSQPHPDAHGHGQGGPGQGCWPGCVSVSRGTCVGGGEGVMEHETRKENRRDSAPGEGGPRSGHRVRVRVERCLREGDRPAVRAAPTSRAALGAGMRSCG